MSDWKSLVAYVALLDRNGHRVSDYEPVSGKNFNAVAKRVMWKAERIAYYDNRYRRLNSAFITTHQQEKILEGSGI